MELKRAPLRVRPIKGEPAYSLFGRLAARNHYDSCRAFAKDYGLKYKKAFSSAGCLMTYRSYQALM